MSGVWLDALRESDAERCAELERQLFPGDDPWSARAFRDEIRAGAHYVAARVTVPLAPSGAVPSAAGLPGTGPLGGRPTGAEPAPTGPAPTGLAPVGAGSPSAGSTVPVGGAAVGGPAGAELLVGYAGVAVVGAPPDADAEVHTIAVDPAYQGRGIGRLLLRELLDVADAVGARVFLEVRTDNEPAHKLYESEGFAVVGLRRRYYSPSGADAHTMRRESRR